jgi:molecular chaperone DnaJ
VSATSHYDALGVPSWATADEVQRAYRRRARLLHPDHLASQDLSSAERARADQQMREVNEAWRVLREPGRRAAYDASRRRPSASGSGGPTGSRTAWTGPYPTPRTPPPRARAPQGRLPSDEPALQHRLGIVVWVLLAVALIGIFVTSAYLSHPRGDDSPAPAPSPVAGVCVRVSTGPHAVTVPCSEPNDGRIVGHVLDPASCPAGSVARRIVAGDPGLSCLQPVS